MAAGSPEDGRSTIVVAVLARRSGDVGGGGRGGGYCGIEARVAALKRKVGGLTMELDLVKKHRGR